MRVRIRRMTVGSVIAMLVIGLLSSFAISPANATNGGDFNPANIISDANFFNGSAMDANAVQAFLDARVPYCQSGYSCLKSYRQDTWTRAADPMCGAYQGASGESAAQIIAKVGLACNVSQKVLLVLLQKEQSLVTDNWPGAGQYRSATGYGCPDTAPCDSEFYGFYNQVYKAAWQYKRYANPAGTSAFYTWYPVGRTSNVLYSPTARCGSSPVVMQNLATAGLYYYTPYQPNGAALANLYGTGDDCSAYGNRNFWRMYSDWFGSPTNPTSPVGNVEQVSTSPSGLRVRGWALDFDTMNSIDVHVYVDGQGYATKAALSRPDVAQVYGRSSNAYGYSIDVPAGPGSHFVCVYGINVGPGGNSTLGCGTYVVPSGNPFGNLETPYVSGTSVTLTGWAIDPDAAKPINVDVYVSGAGIRLLANAARPDVGSYYPDYGANHGYSTTMSLPVGTYQACAYGINVGAGVNTLLACQNFSVHVDGTDHGRPPFGNVDSITPKPGSVDVSGWAIDPDTAGPIHVDVYAGSSGIDLVANGTRADVAAVYPGYGSAHGFSGNIPSAPGNQNVCFYGLNTGAGGNSLIYCTKVFVPALPPIGNFDQATAVPGGLHVRGWAFTPRDQSPVSVDVYVDGSGYRLTANESRPDVENAFPGAGSSHGFDAVIPAAQGIHQVCAYAVEPRASSNPWIGCHSVTVP